MNISQDSSGSLTQLRDIMLPAPPSIWPLAPGVWLLLSIIVITLLFSGIYLYRKWRRNDYRRAGLLLLQDAASVHDVFVVLKRVALAVYPRKQVASLYGDEWIAFLNEKCSQVRFQDISGQSDKQTRQEEIHSAIHSAAIWIKHHTAPEKE